LLIAQFKKIEDSLGHYRNEFKSFNSLSVKIASLPVFSPSSRIHELISSVGNPASNISRYYEIAESVSFSEFIKEYPTVSNEDIDAVTQLIDSSKAIQEAVKEIIDTGSEIISSSFSEEEKAVKFDEWFNETLYNNFFKKLGISKQSSFLIAFVILTLLIIAVKKPIESFIWGDSSKQMASTLKKHDSKINELEKRYSIDQVRYGKTKKNCILRARNDFNSDSLTQVNSNTEVQVIFETTKWYKVSLANDTSEIQGFLWKNNVSVQ
jgi:hypothetical protein